MRPPLDGVRETRAASFTLDVVDRMRAIAHRNAVAGRQPRSICGIIRIAVLEWLDRQENTDAAA